MMKRLLNILIGFVVFTGYSQQLTFITTSSANAWSPQLVTNGGAVLSWTATGSNLVGSPVVINANDPTFDFSSNDGSPISITVSNTDNFAGLTQLDLYNTIDGGLITDMDIANATALTYLNGRYNQLTSLDISNNAALSRLIVRGNRQLPNQALNTSANLQLNEIWLDGTGINAVDFSINPQLLFVKMNNAMLTSAVLNQVLIDLDMHNLSGGNLQISGQATGQSITIAASAAYANLSSKGWTIDVPAPVVDTEAPVAGVLNNPTGITQNSLTLSWTAGSDNVGVTNYNIYKNGSFETQLGNVTSYQVTGLAANTLYSYYLTALDGAGNESSNSNTVQATTLNTPTGNTITFTTTSSANAWSPQLVTNSGATLSWSASGSALAGSPIVINANDPTFDFSSNNGSPISITVTSTDGFVGLTHLDLYNSIDGGEVTDMDISNATALTLLNMRYNELNSINVNNNSALTRLIIRGNRQIPDQAINTSANTLLNYIQLDGTGINAVDFSNNPLLLDVRINNARLSSAVLDQVLNDLDAHGLSGGFLQIASNPGALTSNAYVAYNNLTNKGWFIDVLAPAPAAGPEINIQGNSVSISGDGTNTPGSADNTDFGSVTSGGTIVKTFTIQNLGDANLVLTGNPLVAISGANAADFSISAPPVSPVAPTGSTTFDVTYTASSLGIRSAVLTIASDDADEPNYIFNIEAEATAAAGPVITVSGNGSIITNGNVPSSLNGTDFGSTNIGNSISQSISVENTGNVSFTLFGSAITSGAGIYNTIPAVITGITLNPGDPPYVFQVTFSPNAAGDFIGQVQLFSNAQPNPYILNFTGEGIDPANIQEIMISQYYDGFNGADKWIEVKNISNQVIPAGKYYLALYDQSQSLTGVPTQNQVIPAMIAGEVVLFKNANAVIPAAGNLGQAGTSSLVCSFDNGDDIIIISLSNGTNSYGNRVDMIGRQDTWGRNTTYIKGGCATESAHRDFNETYWIRIAVEDINNANPLTNLALGTQAIGPTSPTSIDISSWSNGPSDRTRSVIINSSINPVSIVACDLTVASGLTVNYSGGTTATLDLFGDLFTSGASLIIGDTESLLTRDPNASLGTITKLEKSNTLFNLHDNTYWSSPIKSATIQGTFPGVNPDRIFEYRAGDPNPIYNYPGSPYLNYIYWWNKGSGDMAVGYGYAAEGPNAPVAANDNYLTPFQHEISFTGIPNNGNQIIDVFYKTSEDVGDENGNFNLLGNPYPTAINIQAFLANNDNVYQIALWTHATEISGGSGGEFTAADYVFYNQGGSNSPFVTPNIGSSQGFMVRTTLSGGQVTYSNVFKLANANNQFFKTEITQKGLPVIDGQNDRIWLRMHDGSVKSDILVGFFENASDGVDERYDAIGIATDKNINLYSLIDQKNYIIQGLGSFSPEKSIPLGFNIKETNDLSLSISGLEGVFVGTDVYLVDHALNKTHNLKEGAYKFNQTATGDFPNRFTLHFSKNALDVDKIIEGSEFNVFHSGEGFRINASKVVKEVRVYDMLGRTVINSKPEQQSFYLNAGNLKTGAVLIFEVKLENGTILNKKAIKM